MAGARRLAEDLGGRLPGGRAGGATASGGVAQEREGPREDRAEERCVRWPRMPSRRRGVESRGSAARCACCACCACCVCCAGRSSRLRWKRCWRSRGRCGPTRWAARLCRHSYLCIRTTGAAQQLSAPTEKNGCATQGGRGGAVGRRCAALRCVHPLERPAAGCPRAGPQAAGEAARGNCRGAFAGRGAAAAACRDGTQPAGRCPVVDQYEGFHE